MIDSINPKAGIIIYKRNLDGKLEGTWTHHLIKGAKAFEVAVGPKDDFIGDYQVDIFDAKRDLIWNGKLAISNLGESFQLDWDGKAAGDTPLPPKFIGIGLALSQDSLAATFEEV